MISSSDFMGELSIPLHGLPADQPLSKWFLLAASGTPSPFLFLLVLFSSQWCYWR